MLLAQPSALSEHHTADQDTIVSALFFDLRNDQALRFLEQLMVIRAFPGTTPPAEKHAYGQGFINN